MTNVSKRPPGRHRKPAPRPPASREVWAAMAVLAVIVLVAVALSLAWAAAL